MARTRTGVLPIDPLLGITQLGLTLDRYCDVMLGMDRITRCSFNGITIPTTIYVNEFLNIVSQSQRDQLARYLVQAETRREEQLGYYLGYKWTVYERHRPGANNPYSLRHKHLRAVGYPTQADISLGEALDYGTPPFITSVNMPTDPVAVTVTTSAELQEIIVTYPGEDVRIHPDAIVDNGDGTVTIYIPRCRLVDPDYNDDRQDPISYLAVDPFLTTVDVKRMYADAATGAHFVWNRPNCVTDCVARCQVACHMLDGQDAYELSLIDVMPADRSGSAWSTTSFAYNQMPDVVRFSYLSGKDDMSNQIYTARLAHTLMPRPPCNCDIVKQKWTEDREQVPRVNTRYGSTRGALDTWLADADQKIGSGGMFPGMH